MATATAPTQSCSQASAFTSSAQPANQGSSSHSLPSPMNIQQTKSASQTDASFKPDFTPQSFPGSPDHFPTDLSHPILEETGESELDSPLEPVTPQSASQSGEFQKQDSNEDNVPHSLGAESLSSYQDGVTTPTKDNFSRQLSRTPSAIASPAPQRTTTDLSQSLPRRSTFNRVVSKVFKRSNSAVSQQSGDGTEDNSAITTPAPPTPGRGPSQNPSQTTTRSNSPPSPESPLEMAVTSRTARAGDMLPGASDFDNQNKAQNRTSTGLAFRGRRIGFSGSVRSPPRQHPRRANSFDAGPGSSPHVSRGRNEDEEVMKLEPQFWALAPDAGTGTKARRMSLSLPDDFQVSVTELTKDFEYHSKFGRHGRHLGKGAASKVTLMHRKGNPEELYAVKEFRGKSKQDTKDEYEKKIKSEYSIAKSLHHPNVVETISLCLDHGRWNHVMEYCAEGDLFSLVSKKYLHLPDALDSRLCFFKQLLQGIYYLHSHGIAHRDIKLDNCLITSDSKLKITDFGVSEVFSGTHPGLREAGGVCGVNMDDEVRLCSPGICGSMPYIAPEVLAKKDKYDPRALDVWSAAIVMIHLVFGGALWESAQAGQGNYDSLVKGWRKWEDKHEEGAKISSGDYPCCKWMDLAVNPPPLRRVLWEMLHPDPEKRITMEEVINRRWVDGIECCQADSFEDPCMNIDATKKCTPKVNGKRVACHNHLPMKTHKISVLRAE